MAAQPIAPSAGAASSSSTGALRFKRSKKFTAHRLPFVGKAPTGDLSFWAVPKTGGYEGGNETGAALARIYLKSLHEGRQSAGGMLQCMVLDMFGCEPGGPLSPEQEALRGQVVGFFSVLEEWIGRAAERGEGAPAWGFWLRENPDKLGELDAPALLQGANRGLGDSRK